MILLIKEATEKLTKVFYDMSEQLYKNALTKKFIQALNAI